MNPTAMQSIFFLAIIVNCVYCRPSHPGREEVRQVARAPRPHSDSSYQVHEHIAEYVTPEFEQSNVELEEAELQSQIRVRRAPGDEDRGNVDVTVNKEKGVGTVVSAKGQGNVWSSNDGRTSVDAQGEWSKVVRGPARGKPSYSGGISIKHRF